VWINERFSSALVLALIALGYAAERRRRTSD
jgi:MYXO-CTERM domain-containing protein